MPPFPAEQARRVVAEDLGRPVHELFTEFDDVRCPPRPSHRCTPVLLPDGRPAVVKLRRPGIERHMITDLRIMYLLARVLDR